MSFKSFLWGEIPEGWTLKKLYDMSEYISRGKQPKYVGHSEIRTLNQKCIRWYDLQEENFKYQNPAIKVADKHYIKINDVVLNSTGVGTVGRAYHFDYQPSSLFADSHVTIIRTKEDELISRFLMYQLATSEYQSFIESSYLAGSTGQVEFNKSKVMELPILVPPLEEQDRIVQQLYNIDKKIENSKQISKNLEEMTRAIFKHWFLEFDFPNGEGEPYKSSGGEMVESELGLIPNGWQVKELGSLVDLHTRSIKPFENPEVLYEHYSIPALDDDIFPQFEKGEEIRSNKYEVIDSSILISKLNPQKKRIWYPNCLSNNAVCSTEFINYVPEERKLKNLVYGIIDSKEFSDFLVQHATGSTNSRQRVKPKETLNYKISLPMEGELLNLYENTVKAIYEKIVLERVEVKRLSEIRETLLPKLMSGEIRVPLESESNAV